MSVAAMNYAYSVEGLEPTQKLLLIVIAWNHTDLAEHERGCFATQKKLAKNVNVDRSTINRHLQVLEAEGHIFRDRRFCKRTGRQQATRYRFPIDFPIH